MVPLHFIFEVPEKTVHSYFFFELSEINRGPVNSDFRPPSATSVWIDGFIGRPLHCIALVENNPAKLTFGLDFCENEKTSTVLISTENKDEVEQKRRLLQRNKAASETNTTTGFEEIQQ